MGIISIIETYCIRSIELHDYKGNFCVDEMIDGYLYFIALNCSVWQDQCLVSVKGIAKHDSSGDELIPEVKAGDLEERLNATLYKLLKN